MAPHPNRAKPYLVGGTGAARVADRPAIPGTLREYLIASRIHYRRQRDLPKLAPDLPTEQFQCPDQLYAASPFQAWRIANANHRRLISLGRSLLRLGQQRDPGYCLYLHADVVAAAAAESITALWCERRMADRAGVLTARTPLEIEVDVDPPTPEEIDAF